VWRALPADPPRWRTAYGYVRTWQASGTTRSMHDELRHQVRRLAGRAAEPTAAVIGSPSVKAAGTVGNATRGYDAGKKIEGRQRHIATGTLGLILVTVVTAACVQDRDAVRHLLWRLGMTWGHLSRVTEPGDEHR
jgi:transposase